MWGCGISFRAGTRSAIADFTTDVESVRLFGALYGMFPEVGDWLLDMFVEEGSILLKRRQDWRDRVVGGKNALFGSDDQIMHIGCPDITGRLAYPHNSPSAKPTLE